MNVRLVASPILVLLLSVFADGQQAPRSGEQIGTAVTLDTGSSFKQELAHHIVLLEAFVRQAEAAHATDAELARRYVKLGVAYENATQWARSEAALEHAIALARHAPEPNAELAAAISQLGILHVAMGKLRESEKEELQGLKLREQLGDRLQVAHSWTDLSALYLVQHKFEKARDFAQKAVAEFVVNKQAGVFDKNAARSSLSLALCYLKDCPSAIPLLKDAIDEAKAKLLPEDFAIGFGEFLLGYAYWKSGDMSEAGRHMQDGTATMSRQLGWGHPSYLAALKKYEQFLRENRQAEAANVVEREIRQRLAVIDVHSIQTGQVALGFDGLR
jgi:tetratricopeptide (TPR) repeat protein